MKIHLRQVLRTSSVQNVTKYVKIKSGLTSRHTTVKHRTKSEKAEDIQKFENITIKTLFIDTQKALSEDECFPKHLREKIHNYTSNPSEDLVYTYIY